MGKIFKRGLLAVAPVAISIAIIIWLFKVLEDIFRVPLKGLVGKYYFPGMGLLVAVVLIYIIGIVVNNLIIQKGTRMLDRLFARIPLFKTIYTSIADMMSYFHQDATKGGRMVVVEMDSMKFLAIVTREDFEDLPEELGDSDCVAIFIPFSYQIGGFTVSVPRSKVKPIDLSVEQGMRFIVTAGMVSGKGAKPIKKDPETM